MFRSPTSEDNYLHETSIDLESIKDIYLDIGARPTAPTEQAMRHQDLASHDVAVVRQAYCVLRLQRNIYHQ